MLQKEYRTVLELATACYEDRRSRFIATVRPVDAEEEALEFISEVKTKYWDATHNVYAYCLGGNNTIQRFSDAGEPSGTAGLPVLETIKKMGIQDLAVVVTRYFGGTLLGAAGLIRAYGKSASLGIDAAGIVMRSLCSEITLMLEYPFYGRINSMIISKGYAVKSVEFAQDVIITVYVPVDEVGGFRESVIEATNAGALFEEGEKAYITLDLEGKIIKTG